MVHLFRGGVRGHGRGRGFARPGLPRYIRPHGYECDYMPPPPYGLPLPRPRANMPVRPPMRPPVLMPSPRLPLPPQRLHPPHPRPPLHIPPMDRPMPFHPRLIHPPVRGRGIPPRMPLGLLRGRGRGLLRPQIAPRGRGGAAKRGVVKRLVSANGRAKKNQKRKEKTEGEFFCDSCDRGWKTQEKLDEHIALHQVCGREGCQYTAAPKLVSKHIEVIHDSGLYQHVSADADKWIAERKSRYPTKENVGRKEAQRHEMIERGERIPSQGKRFQNNQNYDNLRTKRQRTQKNHIKREVCIPSKPKRFRNPPQTSQWRDPDSWRGDLPKFPGTAAFPLNENCDTENITKEQVISDEEEWNGESKKSSDVILNPTVSNVLASIMANYGSDMSDDDDISDSANNQQIKPKEAETKPQNNVVCIKNGYLNAECAEEKESKTQPILRDDARKEDSEDGDSGPEECAIDHKDKSNVPLLVVKEKKEPDLKPLTDVNDKVVEHNNNYNSTPSTHQKRHQFSLLDKLLKSEIRHERNVILQCVRHIVRNNFFGIGNLGNCKTVNS